MMFDTWDGQIFYPRFYDLDTICSYDNSGQIKFDVDVEMEQGYWNTSSSRLWTKIRDWMHDDLVEIYKDMRQNGLSFENLMKYFYDDQISVIPQTYYNKDADIKYIPYADQYIGKAHGDGYQHLKRWLKRRITFCDTLFDYTPSYTNDILTIRANTTEEMTLEIETYSPVYQHLSWYNNQMDKKKIDGKTAITFTGTAQASTDQEILIYGGSNIKAIRGISSTNPNQVLIGSATRLTEIDLSNCPILTTVNSDKANFTPHTYLNKLDISNCPQLGGILKANNSPLLREINAKNTAVTGIQLPPSIRNLEVLRLPNSISTLTLNDAGLLNTLEFDDGINLQSIALTNCNNLTNCINFDLTKTPTVLLDNSYNAEELYMSEITDLTLKNMPTLKRVIYTPNDEYEEFDINNVINGKNYKVTTFNNPNMKEFITTAPYRLSYNDNVGTIEIPQKTITNSANFKPGTIDEGNGLVDHSYDSTRAMSTFVPFTQTGSISYTSSNSSIYFLGRCYDKYFNFITPNPTTTWQVSGTWNIPSGTAYIRLIIRTSNNVVPSTDDINNLSVTLGNTTIQCVWNENATDDGYILHEVEVKDYGDITPNTVFSANTLDLSDTQFTDIKFLCTTDLYNLKVPTTMKNFYCDSAMDIDTEVITDASYEVIHDELIEQYTTNYSNEVLATKNVYTDYTINELEPYTYQADTWSLSLYSTDYIDLNASEITVIPTAVFKYCIRCYDSSKTLIKTYVEYGAQAQSPKTFSILDGTKYVKVGLDCNFALSYNNSYTPNIIPSSASGSLIFNLYSNNTTQPTSTSPYMWDLTGLKLNDFYTYGMNNWVKASDDSYIIEGEDVLYLGVGNYQHNDGLIQDNSGLMLNLIKTPSSGILNISSDTATAVELKVRYFDSDKNCIAYQNGLSMNTDNVLNNTESTYIGINITQTNISLMNDYIDLTVNGVKYICNTSLSVYKFKQYITDLDLYNKKLLTIQSITMPQRLPGYSVRMVNTDITPNNYANHLYPLLVDTTLPITGKLDYSKYQGTSLAWAYAYTTNDVAITPLGSQHQGNITNDYNKLYGTDYVDIVDVWAYKDDDFSNKSTNEAITKAYIELTSSNYKTRIDEVLQWYPNCTELYLFEDGSVTILDTMFHNNNTNTKNQIVKVEFMEGYFSGVTSMYATFYSCSSLTTVPTIPNSVTNMPTTFENCTSLTTPPTIPNGVTNMNSTFKDCTSLTIAPNIPNSVISMYSTFQNCRALTTVPTIPNGVTNMNSTFKDCTSLTIAPNIPNSVTNMSSIFQNCSALTTAPSIPSTCCNIENAFQLSAITSITLPIATIGINPNNGQDFGAYYSGALYGCSNLTDITWEGERNVSFNLISLGSNITYTQADIQELVPEHLYDLLVNKLTIVNKTGTLNDTYSATTNCAVGNFIIGSYNYYSTTEFYPGTCRMYKAILNGVEIIPILDENGNPCFLNTQNNSKYYNEKDGGILTAGTVVSKYGQYDKLDHIMAVGAIVRANDITVEDGTHNLEYYFKSADAHVQNTHIVNQMVFSSLKNVASNFSHNMSAWTGGGYGLNFIDSDGNSGTTKSANTIDSSTLTLGETYLAYLTEEEITSAVAKGWTLQ